jgi:glyoxylase-like metal-dependent hydrolase (beta-lactamase superfamily II)
MNDLFMIPLEYGGFVTERSLNYLRRFAGQKESGKDIGVYIGSAKKRIVVDTGSPDMERIIKYHPYSEREPIQPYHGVDTQLSLAGVRPEEIEIVVLTHLHWDHVGGVTQFPNAEFIVSQKELGFALDPLPCLHVAYEALQIGMQPEFLKVIKRIKTVNMEEKEITRGVRLIPLPGHTPGSMGVVVETGKGPFVIAGDAVPMYMNLKGIPEEGLPYLMSGVYTDMVAMWKSFEKIDEIVCHDISRVIPGHDPLVFQKRRYP